MWLLRALAKHFETLFFAVSVGVLCFVYGVATMYYQIFPYETIMDVKRAWQAMRRIEPARLPANVLGNFPGNASLPAQSFTTGPGGPVLIAGGFYQLMERCPEHGCMAWVMDRDGQILHTWSADPAVVFDGLDDIEALSGQINDLSIYISGLALAPDGGLVTVFQGRNTFPYQIGIAKFSIDGALEWKRFDFSHHWPTVDGDGTIFVPSVRLQRGIVYAGRGRTETNCEDDVLRSEGVRVLSSQGEELAAFWFDEILAAADYPGLAHAVPEGCNPHHVNGIAVVTEAAAALLPRARAGDLAVSLREPSAVVVIDRDTGALRHLIAGRFSAQHSPGFLADGRLVVFDNRGGDRAHGGSRIVAVNPSTDETETLFPQGDEAQVLPFFSRAAGVLAVSPDSDRLLISESQTGRVIEVDAETSDPLWLMLKNTDLRPFYDARGLSSETDMVRFSTQGAYYVDPGNPVLAEGN